MFFFFYLQYGEHQSWYLEISSSPYSSVLLMFALLSQQ
ncbi:E3 20.8 kDa protein [Human adenovirus 55]|uniref:E3 20.8 kDa protein n=1 Tax=Human adenovirus 55 TaxID=714978 RepID=A0A7L9R057_9ADEN|nr:E3 20.8 kDa protein [Human adenovirus 55]QOL08552.1 E3 20.8 kDa protein [Human adenovirus 55]QOL08585.1 E3 20.8 kDa protein [Human adenovirus 55]QOL08618.1 E3 20.8 kDa protein [Human adenovirus 55]QOL08651.1 E3 20.8 kDa protein [Human adenovirus 55]